MRGQVKREVTQEEFDKLVAENPDLEKRPNGMLVRREKMAGGWWLRPIAGKVGDKFYVMRPA
jgi:hypothetical protein